MEKTEQKRPSYIVVYHKDGTEWRVESVKLGHFKNVNGTQGKASYIVKFKDGVEKCYPREDIVGIMPIWEKEQ